MKYLFTYLISFSLFLISCSENEDYSGNHENYSINLNLALETDWEMANNINSLINIHRNNNGLPSLKVDKQYASAYAVDHTLYMIRNNRISHDNFNNRSAALKERGANTVAENVAFGYTSAEDVVRAWLNSPPHKKIIEGSYSHSGFGIMKNDKGHYFFTQLFYDE